jgi:hypothetical protein
VKARSLDSALAMLRTFKFERGNSMTNLNKVVASLRTEYARLQKGWHA